MKLPRNAQLWLPGYAKDRIRRWIQPPPQPRRVWLAICDHYEPLWYKPDWKTALGRVMQWRDKWPQIAAGIRDSAGQPPKYTFFFPQEEYHKEFVEPLAEMTRGGVADVEVHIHHDGEGRENFITRMTDFCKVLHEEHGMLRRRADGKLMFGFIHGNWALDNSLPGGKWCGLNDEITILRDLGCYADFSMPSGNSPSQARTVNVIYWAKDDPNRPKSYEHGAPVEIGGAMGGDIMMIPGPMGVRWTERMMPRLETGELASTDYPTPYRVRRWLEIAPRLGENVFVKLYTHGAQERNSSMLLNGELTQMYKLVSEEAGRQQCEYFWVTAWQMYQAIEAVRQRQDPLSVLLNIYAGSSKN